MTLIRWTFCVALTGYLSLWAYIGFQMAWEVMR